MGGIKALIVLSVTTFDFTVMPWSKRSDQLVPDAMLHEPDLKQGGFVPVRGETIGKLCTVIRLDTFNRQREYFYEMLQKDSGRIGVMLLEGLHIAPAGILIYSSILEELFSNDLAVFQTGRGDKFHINLNPLSRILHLFIVLGDILRVGRLHSQDSLLSEDAIEP